MEAAACAAALFDRSACKKVHGLCMPVKEARQNGPDFGRAMFVSRIGAALKARPLSEIFGYGVILVRNALGLPNRMPTPDRDTLEKVILPSYAARPDIKMVLFVGCAWYTHHYEQMLPGRVGRRANLSSGGTTFWNAARWSWPACNPWRAFVR